jgi:hypothetical protein
VAAKALIGVLPDGLALPDRLTGREVLMYLGLLRGMSREVVGQRADGPAADGGPSPARVLKKNVAVIAVPAVTLFPAGGPADRRRGRTSSVAAVARRAGWHRVGCPARLAVRATGAAPPGAAGTRDLLPAAHTSQLGLTWAV